MEPKVFTNRNSLVGSAAREAESARAEKSGFCIEPGSAARAAEAETSRRWKNDEGLRINLRAQPVRQPTTRLFPGPSARPVPAVPVEPTVQAVVPLPEPAAAPVSLPVQQAPYPPTSQPGTVTSIGARFKHAFLSLFT